MNSDGEIMAMTEAEKEFLTPASPVNEAAFSKMCAVLELDASERQLARMAISTYETAKGRHDGQH